MATAPTPIVLVSNRRTASGHSYADRTGVSYEYPTRYRSMIVPGAPFVYYRSREGKRQPHYFGTGVVGLVRPSSREPGLLECEILDYRPFEHAVPLRDPSGTHLEESGTRRGYYQPGVRRLTEDEFSHVLRLAQLAPAEAEVVAGEVPPAEAKFGISEAAREVEEYAVERVRELLEERYRGATVRVMARNNPGYDIRVAAADGTVLRYVEVKGTSLAAPVFFLSEGERRFSAREPAQYTIFVVYSVDLDAATHQVQEWEGEVTVDAAALTPVTWSGRLSSS